MALIPTVMVIVRAIIRYLAVAEQEITVPHPADTVPCRVVPGRVHMIPVAINLNHIPGMVHRIAADYLTGNPQLVPHDITKCIRIAIAHGSFIYQGAIQGVGDVRHRIVQIILIIVLAILHQVVVHHKRLLVAVQRSIHLRRRFVRSRLHFLPHPCDIFPAQPVMI